MPRNSKRQASPEQGENLGAKRVCSETRSNDQDQTDSEVINDEDIPAAIANSHEDYTPTIEVKYRNWELSDPHQRTWTPIKLFMLFFQCVLSVVRTSPIRVSVLMEALLIMLLSYGTHTISIYLLLGQQDLRVVLACQWPATGLLRSTAALPTHNNVITSVSCDP